MQSGLREISTPFRPHEFFNSTEHPNLYRSSERVPGQREVIARLNNYANQRKSE